jgi:hypothetical protein
MMKILAALVGLLVLGAGAWYFAGGRASDFTMQPTTTEDTNTNTAANTDTAFKGSMNDLIARGGSWQCDVSATVQGITTSGTTFVSGGKLRGDFSSNVPQFGKIETHMIVKDTTAYTWTSMMNRGFKFPVENGTITASGADAQAAAQFNQAYDYDCRAWIADESKFALPSGITF